MLEVVLVYSKIELLIEGILDKSYKISKVLTFAYDERMEKLTLYYEDYNGSKFISVLDEEDITCNDFDYSKFVCRYCKYNLECEKGWL